jgi:hypothetical protein
MDVRPMDHRIARLKNPEECEQFARNVAPRDAELARQARRRAVELKAEMHGAASEIETAILRAVHAYEEVLTTTHGGKKLSATKTWGLVKKHGPVGAVEVIVNRDTSPEVLNPLFMALVEMDMLDFAFESVVLHHPHLFKPHTVERARQHLQDFNAFR